MLVHKFYLVDCIEVEFKFELNSNRFEWKQESESVILSFLSHSLFSQSFPFLSQSFLSFLSHFPSFLSHSFPFSVIPSFLSYFRSFLCHSFFLRHSPARPHLSAPSSFFPSAQLPPRSPASFLIRARTPRAAPPPYKREPPALWYPEP
jgi:hypothetical protein